MTMFRHAALATLLFASSAFAQDARTIPLPGDQLFPEGVAVTPNGQTAFVGSTTDGRILRVDLSTGQVSTFIEGGGDGPTAATGLKVDAQGRLWISGAGTGNAWVYDTSNGKLIRKLDTAAAERKFINDVAITPSGEAYFTDSFRPFLFRASSTPNEVGNLTTWLDLKDTAIEYGEGFNLNGIVAAGDRYLIAVQSNTGRLYRIDTRDKSITQVDLGEQTVQNGDGLALRGNTLYVVRNGNNQVARVRLTENFSKGELLEPITAPSFMFPTTAAVAKNDLVVVNGQLNRRGGDGPNLPFRLTVVPLQDR